jgi:hypothetical protein
MSESSNLKSIEKSCRKKSKRSSSGLPLFPEVMQDNEKSTGKRHGSLEKIN